MLQGCALAKGQGHQTIPFSHKLLSFPAVRVGSEQQNQSGFCVCLALATCMVK